MGAGTSNFEQKYIEQLNMLALSKQQKSIICGRYVTIVIEAASDRRQTAIAYYILTNIITLVSVFIASLIILGKFLTSAAEVLFWISWSLSIILALSNKMLYSFNISKKYILNGETLEKLYSEGWSFIAGVDRYKKCVDMDQRFGLFCARVEKIKLRSVKSVSELEYVDQAGGILAASPRHSAQVGIESFGPVPNTQPVDNGSKYITIAQEDNIKQ